MRWPLEPLGEIAPIVRRPITSEIGSDYPIIAARSFGRGTFHQPTLEGDELTWQRLFQVRAGDLLVSNIKAWEGAVAVVPDADDGMYCSHRYLTCVADRKRVLPAWLGAFFRTPAAVAQLSAASPGSADRNRTLSMAGLRSVEVPLPLLDVQQRIVERLYAVEARIVRRQREAEAVDAEFSTMLASAFHRITQGVPRQRMAAVAPLVRRAAAIDLESSYPELGVRSFGKGTFHKPPLAGADVGSKRLFVVHSGDLVFSNVFAWEGAVAVAEASDHGRFGSHRFITRVPDPGRATALFLCFWFLTPEGLQKLGEASPGGAGRNRTLGLEALDSIEVPIPSLDAQEWFDALQQKVHAARELQESTVAELDAMFPAILERAFRGEL